MVIKEITPQTLNQWMRASDVVLIDVREVSEYENERIEGSLLMPLAKLAYDQIPLDGKKYLVFQCRSGKRSLFACDKIMDDIDETIEVYSLAGGIIAWREAGLPVLSDIESS